MEEFNIQDLLVLVFILGSILLPLFKRKEQQERMQRAQRQREAQQRDSAPTAEPDTPAPTETQLEDRVREYFGDLLAEKRREAMTPQATTETASLGGQAPAPAPPPVAVTPIPPRRPKRLVPDSPDEAQSAYDVHPESAYEVDPESAYAIDAASAYNVDPNKRPSVKSAPAVRLSKPSRVKLREMIVWREVLGPPVALREPGPSDRR